MEQERCRDCDEPTGNAGRNDDSIHCTECGRGPLCADGYDQDDKEEPVCNYCIRHTL